MAKKLSRRSFLRGAGGAVIGLPFLHAMGCSIGGRPSPDDGEGGRGAASGRTSRAVGSFPNRFIVFYVANGVVRERWLPTGGETDFTIPVSSSLAPLAASHRGNVTILDGVHLLSTELDQPGDGHQRGMGNALSGARNVRNGDVWGGGITIDQIIADQIGGATKFKSLELGVQTATYGSVWTRMSYRGPAQPLPIERDPAKVWNRVFSDLVVDDDEDDGAAEALAARRSSILDSTLEDYRALEGNLGAADRERLQAHIQSVEELEVRVGQTVSVGGACLKPPAPTVAADDTRAISRAQIDLLVMALACDLTRVVSLKYGDSVNHTRYSWIEDGPPGEHHEYVHQVWTEAVKEGVHQVTHWHAGEYAYLLDRLAATPEGDGSLLDSTCVLWCSDMSEGRFHGHENAPFLLGGSAGGAIRTGRFLEYGGVAHNGVLAALAQAYGVDVDEVGDPDVAIPPLSGILT